MQWLGIKGQRQVRLLGTRCCAAQVQRGVHALQWPHPTSAEHCNSGTVPAAMCRPPLPPLPPPQQRTVTLCPPQCRVPGCRWSPCRCPWCQTYPRFASPYQPTCGRRRRAKRVRGPLFTSLFLLAEGYKLGHSWTCLLTAGASCGVEADQPACWSGAHGRRGRTALGATCLLLLVARIAAQE